MTSLRDALIASGAVRPQVARARKFADEGELRMGVAGRAELAESVPDVLLSDAQHNLTEMAPANSDEEELKRKILDYEPSEFVSHVLLDACPWVFDGAQDRWIQWRSKLARGLDVDPREIVMIGSGALGLSINPHHLFSRFDGESDIDIGVVSSHYFNLAWRYLRQLRPEWLSLPPAAKSALKSHRKYIFDGVVATDRILSLLPFGGKWQEALDGMARESPTVGREINLRIYFDYDSLRFYHARGIESLRATLASNGRDETQLDRVIEHGN